MYYIIYNKQDNNIAVITSLPEESISTYFTNFVKGIGGNESSYGTIQTNDSRIFSHKITVDKGSILIGEIDTPTVPMIPSEADELREKNMALQLALAEAVEKQEKDKVTNQLAIAELLEKQEVDKLANQLALAEMIETLTIKGVL